MCENYQIILWITKQKNITSCALITGGTVVYIVYRSILHRLTE